MAAGARRPRRGGGQKIVLVAAGVVALAFPAWLFGGSYLKRRDAALDAAREWTIDGPPCAALSRAEFESRGLKVRKGTVYEGVTFYRQFGHMSCTALRYGAGWGQSTYPACQFTTPKALKVTTPKGEWYFDIGTGQPATVAAPHGQVRCVLAADFTMARLNGRQ
jgi:hypothetical protein